MSYTINLTNHQDIIISMNGEHNFPKAYSHIVSDIKSTRYEEYAEYIFIGIKYLEFPKLNDQTFGIVIHQQQMHILCANEKVYDYCKRVTEKQVIESFDHYVYELLRSLFTKDIEYLESLELKMSTIEDRLLLDKKENYTKEIIRLRKQLLLLKRYYAPVSDMLEQFLGTDNINFIEKHQQHLTLLMHRIEHLNQYVITLRDYITQIRESFQSQQDIELNRIMKIFTVLTAIFLPLTLIVGWYGMNLQMPENSWTYGYPMVIALSILIVIGTIYYFKRNKWF
ncbi:MAG: CorA family divalent cation transporter [Coprobacillaceae bacterium]